MHVRQYLHVGCGPIALPCATERPIGYGLRFVQLVACFLSSGGENLCFGVRVRLDGVLCLA